MALVKASEIVDESPLVLNEIKLSTGSGVFLVEGGTGDKSIKVYYHKPKGYTDQSRILMVIPGAGRNGDSYRDAWVEEAEKYNVLILSPSFEEDDYPFEAYHMAGIIKDINLAEVIQFAENSNVANLNEENLTYRLNTNRNEWLFNEFDHIFDLVVESLNGRQATYDLFGHSAGGQILHRLALFQQETKANTIIAANAGFYTLPDTSIALPFGIKDAIIDNADLPMAFAKKLVLLIGELDNENEKGGTLLMSTTANQQGTHRLERGRYFFDFSQNKASELQTEFNWSIAIVPNVGHNHELMGSAAASLLYK